MTAQCAGTTVKGDRCKVLIRTWGLPGAGQPSVYCVRHMLYTCPNCFTVLVGESAACAHQNVNCTIVPSWPIASPASLDRLDWPELSDDPIDPTVAADVADGQGMRAVAYVITQDWQAADDLLTRYLATRRAPCGECLDIADYEQSVGSAFYQDDRRLIGTSEIARHLHSSGYCVDNDDDNYCPTCGGLHNFAHVGADGKVYCRLACELDAIKDRDYRSLDSSHDLTLCEHDRPAWAGCDACDVKADPFADVQFADNSAETRYCLTCGNLHNFTVRGTDGYLYCSFACLYDGKANGNRTRRRTVACPVCGVLRQPPAYACDCDPYSMILPPARLCVCGRIIRHDARDCGWLTCETVQSNDAFTRTL